MKRTRIVAALLALVLLFSACGKQEKAPETPTEATLGQPLATMFFSYTINSAQRMDTFGDLMPNEGETLVLVNVTVQNTTDAPLPMYDSDFVLQYNGDVASIAWMRDALDDTMQPAEASLAVDESVTWNQLYVIPSDAANLALRYTEVYADKDGAQQTGRTYTIAFEA